MATASADPQRQGRKIAAVLEGARTIFLRDGYAGASVDEIAREAGVSKATLYSYFPDKRHLFIEVARSEFARHASEGMAGLDLNAPVRDVLTVLGRTILKVVSSDFGIALFRVSVAEAERFPEIGREFYASSNTVAEAKLVRYFDHAISRGDLVIEDRVLAAHQFLELCKAWIVPRRLMGVLPAMTEADANRVIGSAVETFLARYGAR